MPVTKGDCQFLLASMSTYTIESYNPEWVKKFEGIKAMLEGVFGSQALAIEHVGSTSVPGMKAKPIIDVLVVVKDISLLDTEKSVMKSKGYLVEENYVAPNSLLFRRIDEAGNKLEHIHVCESGAPMEKQFLAMREYLRMFPEEAQSYALLKDELVKKYPNDYESYRADKDPFLKSLEARAYKWFELI